LVQLARRIGSNAACVTRVLACVGTMKAAVMRSASQASMKAVGDHGVTNTQVAPISTAG